MRERFSPEQQGARAKALRGAFNAFLDRELGGKWLVIFFLKQGLPWLRLDHGSTASSRSLFVNMTKWLALVAESMEEREVGTNVLRDRQHPGKFRQSPLTEEERRTKKAASDARRREVQAKRGVEQTRRVARSRE